MSIKILRTDKDQTKDFIGHQPGNRSSKSEKLLQGQYFFTKKLYVEIFGTLWPEEIWKRDRSNYEYIQVNILGMMLSSKFRENGRPSKLLKEIELDKQIDIVNFQKKSKNWSKKVSKMISGFKYFKSSDLYVRMAIRQMYYTSAKLSSKYQKACGEKLY
jgi:hypothetical protein